MISTNKRLGVDYYSLEFYRYGLFNRSPHTYDSGFHMWDHLACDPHKIYEHVRREHSLAHGLTIVQQHGDYCDFSPNLAAVSVLIGYKEWWSQQGLNL